MCEFIKTNIQKIKTEIKELKSRLNLDYDINLCAVSKFMPLSYIDTACEAGVCIFGENYVDDLVDKFKDKAQECFVHMIGHLQSNKIKKVIDVADSIDSVDSISLLQKINKRAKDINKTIKILFEINSTDEIQKSGFRDKLGLYLALDELANLDSVSFNGMMTMGPSDAGESGTKRAFEKFMNIYESAKTDYRELSFNTRSFGMSGDYKLAIEMGSNFVRIGTAIFGQRKKVQS